MTGPDEAAGADRAAVSFAVIDHVAWITLNRPDSLNAINQAVRIGIEASVTQAESDDAVRVIVVSGAGSKAFCAGADITEFEQAESGVAARKYRYAATAWIDRLSSTRKPTIAAIHGFCLGGGLEIALACDLRIASSDARFGLPEVGLAIIPAAGGTQRLSRTVGLSHALWMILTGDRIDADRAFQLGLVGEVVAPEDLMSRVGECAGRIAGFAPQAVAYAKEAVRAGSELPLSAGLRLERDLSAVLMTTNDRAEASAAFRARRPPEFVGN